MGGKWEGRREGRPHKESVLKDEKPALKKLGKDVPGREHSPCKGPGAGLGLECWRNSEEARVAGTE